MDIFKEGMVFYHKTRNIRCVVKRQTEGFVVFELEGDISGEGEITLNKSVIGSWFFIEPEHINYSLDQLAEIDEYVYNPEIADLMESKKLHDIHY